MPTKNELNALYKKSGVLGGFVPLGEDVNQWYWTSEETNQYFAWAQRFSDGNQNFFPKESFMYIRAACVGEEAKNPGTTSHLFFCRKKAGPLSGFSS